MRVTRLNLLLVSLLGVWFFLISSCDDGADGDADADGDTDIDSDSDGDVDIDTDGDVEPGTCEEPPLAQGVLRNSVADIDFSGDEVAYTIEHKIDIDPEEDGCIAHAEFTVRKAGLGCELHLVFGVEEGGPMLLLDAGLSADSFCPDWRDADEGDYRLVSGTPVFSFVDRVPDRTAESSCIGNALVSFGGPIQLESDGRAIEINIDELYFLGDFLSHGNPDLQCACSPNCGGRVCGPDPVCNMSCGECSMAERCSAAGFCE